MSEKLMTAFQLEEGLALLRSFDIHKLLGEVGPVVQDATTPKGAFAKLLVQGEASTWNAILGFLGQAGHGALLREVVLIVRSDTATLRGFKTDEKAKEEALWKLADEPAKKIIQEAVGFFAAVVPTLLSALPSSAEQPMAANQAPAAKKTPSRGRGRK